jgi:hypothetical protein
MMTHLPNASRVELGQIPSPFPPVEAPVWLCPVATGAARPWKLIVIDAREATPEELEAHLAPLPPGDLVVRLHTGDSPSWLPNAHAALGAMAGHLDALARGRGHRLNLWARACDIISDTPSLLSFLRARGAWRFLVDPGAMLSAEMLPRAAEHIERYLEVFATHPQAAAIVVGQPSAEGNRTVPVGTAGCDALVSDLTSTRLLALAPPELPVFWPSP